MMSEKGYRLISREVVDVGSPSGLIVVSVYDWFGARYVDVRRGFVDPLGNIHLRGPGIALTPAAWRLVIEMMRTIKAL